MLKTFDKPTLAALFALIVLPWVIFWPGVSGPFLLDDILNLHTMGNFGGITNIDSLRAFVFNGVATELGRPLAMLTFVLDGQNWPTDPEPFKRTNILIHMLNGLLLFVIARRLFVGLGIGGGRAAMAAGLAAAIWLLHPTQVATVLYVVQRMTELSALFMLLGIWGYLLFRQKEQLIGMTVVVAVATALAVLCKENGALLPLLILVLEFTLLGYQPRDTRWWRWAWLVLIVPTLVLVAYMMLKVSDPAQAYALRDFTLYQRLLTEPRILLDYLHHLFFPVEVPELLHDDYPVSTSLFDSLKTPMAIGLLASLLALALWQRRCRPLVSFAVLWFLAGHVLESTVLPLELYFEHRNYLPYIGPVIAIAFYLVRLPWGGVVGAVLVVVLAATSWHYSEIWGDQGRLLESWYQQSPGSKRTLNEYAFYQLDQGNTELAYQLFQESKAKFPNHLGTQMFSVAVGCVSGKLTQAEYGELLQNAERLKLDVEAYLGYSRLYSFIADGSCQLLNAQAVKMLGRALLVNKTIADDPAALKEAEESVYLVMSDLFLKQGNLPMAIKALDEVYAAKPQTGIPLRQAYFAIQARQWELAEHYLALAEQSDQVRNPLTASRQPDIQALRDMVRQGRGE